MAHRDTREGVEGHVETSWSTLGVLVEVGTHEIVVGHMRAWLDTWKSTGGQPWEDSRTHAGVH